MRRRRLNGWLALLAIAIQIVLAFGHIALPGPRHQDGPLQQALEHLLDSNFPSISRNHGKTDHEQPGHKNCPTCWLQSATGSLTMPEAAAVVVIVIYTLVAWHVFTSQVSSFALLEAFRVRAPPASAMV